MVSNFLVFRVGGDLLVGKLPAGSRQAAGESLNKSLNKLSAKTPYILLLGTQVCSDFCHAGGARARGPKARVVVVVQTSALSFAGSLPRTCLQLAGNLQAAKLACNLPEASRLAAGRVPASCRPEARFWPLVKTGCFWREDRDSF